jgi:hypothetical protein
MGPAQPKVHALLRLASCGLVRHSYALMHFDSAGGFACQLSGTVVEMITDAGLLYNFASYVS